MNTTQTNRTTELQAEELHIVVAGEPKGARRQMILLEQRSTGRKFFLESRADVNEAVARAAQLQGKLYNGNLKLEQVVMDRHGIKMIKWSEI